VAKDNESNFLRHLECGQCGEHYDAQQVLNLCTSCARPLLARYDLGAARSEIDRDDVSNRPHSLWRFHVVVAGARCKLSYNAGRRRYAIDSGAATW